MTRNIDRLRRGDWQDKSILVGFWALLVFTAFCFWAEVLKAVS